MDFKSKLYEIDSELTQDDLDSLKFLCSDLLTNKKLLAIKSNLDLFEELEKKSLIEENKFDLLVELLYMIGQYSLLRILNTDKWAAREALKKDRTVSLYRQMLFELYEEISSEDLRSILFLLKIPKKYEENKKFLDVLTYLEKNDQLSEDNLEVLEKAICKVSPELLRKMNDYKKSRASTQSVSNEYEDKTPFSIEASKVPAEDREESVGELIQHVAETAYEKGLMDENTENMSDLSLNEQNEQESSGTSNILEKENMYLMNRKHRGYCLIISNSEFAINGPRRGTEKDTESLNRVFTWLGMDVEIRQELLAEEIQKCLTDFSQKDHTDRDCFICCILTHGRSQVVLGTDEGAVHINEIISYFSPKNCKTLTGKPKLFFIQACQGQNTQGAHTIQADAISSVDDRKDTITIPNGADFLIGMSTVDGYYSYRHIKEGTWYIQALCENLTKMVPKGEDILSILTKVNKDVSEREYTKEGKITLKQMPQPSYTLRRKLVFPKPLTPYKPPFNNQSDL